MTLLGMHIIPALVAMVIAAGTAILAAKAAPILGLLDLPGGRKHHAGPVPRVGGLALVAVLVLASAFKAVRLPLSPLEVVALSAFALLGFIDDRENLSARRKALFTLLVSLLLATGFATHVSSGLEPLPFLGMRVTVSSAVILPWVVSMFWFVPQAYNLIDGANGLAIGFGIVVTGALWAAGLRAPVLLGALAALLCLNWPRARIFLGDCGSLVLGLLLVILAQKVFLLSRPEGILWLFAYPTADVMTVILIRTLNGKPISMGDRNHFHFQIQDRWPRLAPLAVPMILGVAAMSASGVVLRGGWTFLPCLGVGLLMGMAILFTVLGTERWRRPRTVDERPQPVHFPRPVAQIAFQGRQTPLVRGLRSPAPRAFRPLHPDAISAAAGDPVASHMPFERHVSRVD